LAKKGKKKEREKIEERTKQIQNGWWEDIEVLVWSQ